jgi:hypothetical protein
MISLGYLNPSVPTASEHLPFYEGEKENRKRTRRNIFTHNEMKMEKQNNIINAAAYAPDIRTHV